MVSSSSKTKTPSSGAPTRREKRWILLATCAMTRAVHLEVCRNMDTDNFLASFSNFCARRGVPERVRSDNGGSFVKGETEIQEALRNIKWDQVMFKTSLNGVQEWDFSPPYTPHMNGLSETMVKQSKRAMNMALLSHDLNDHELISVVIGAEALLNSRPLTHISDDPNDKDGYLITPNHFLMGQAGGQFAPNVGEQIQRVPKARWLYLQRLIAHFWKLWMSYLVPALQSRPKWRNESENLKKGQLVVLLEQKSPRGLWPLGRIIKTWPGQDGRVRVVDVESKGMIYNRNVNRVCPTSLFATEKQ
jgi:hypothetical protein